MSNKINNLQNTCADAFLKAGVLVTLGAMSAGAMADTSALTGGTRQGAAAAGESLGAVTDRGVSGMNRGMEVISLGCGFFGFILFILGVIDFTNLNKQGSNATVKGAFIKIIVAAILGGAAYFFWSSANSASGNV